MKSEFYTETFISFVALLLFLNSFFPIANYAPPTHNQMHYHLREPRYQRTVLMVLDALRVDYIETKSNVPNITKLLQDPRFEVCEAKAMAKIPTTTLPGIKGLTTGAPTSFFDLLYNYGDEVKVFDSIIHQMYKMKKRMIFYGEELWDHLYSPFFLRSEAIHVSDNNDFDTIDTSITNHLRTELSRNDWDILIMHYAGLDRIGHVEQLRTPSIKRKLKEYDGVVTEILDNLQLWEKKTGQKSLFIITGDHGMLDNGNHGGVIFEEAVTPMIFFGLPCEKNNISMLQIDIVPLLSVLLAAPIPSTSVAKIIPELYSKVSDKEKLPIFQEYFLHLSKLSNLPRHVLKDIKGIEEEIKNLQISSKHNITTKIIDLYEKGIALMSDNLTNLTEMDLYSAILAMIILISSLIVVVLSLGNFFPNDKGFKDSAIPFTIVLVTLLLLIHNGFCAMNENSCSLCLGNHKNNVTIILAQGLYFSCLGYNLIMILYCSSCTELQSLNCLAYFNENKALFVFLLAFIFRGFLFIGEIFMVYDRSMLFYFCTAAIAYVIYDLACLSNRDIFSRKALLHGVICLIFVRIAKENFKDFWINDNVKDLQWLYFMLILLILFGFNNIYFDMKITTTILYGFTLISIYVYRVVNYDVQSDLVLSLNDTWDIVNLARICFLFIFITSGKFIYDKKSIRTLNKKLDCVMFVWILLNTLLLRPYQIPSLFAIFYISQYLLKSWTKSLVIKAIVYVWIGNIFFYSQGNTDLLISVDFPVGFTGLRSFNLFIFTVLTLIPLYSAPVFSYVLLRKEINREHILTIQYIDELSESSVVNYSLFIHYLFLFIQLGVLMLFKNRHWFIWNLYAPKLLYFSFNFIVFLLCLITT